MTRATWRTARSHHRCECGRLINATDRYIEHVASPHHGEIGNTTWWRLYECADCAQRHGRAVAS